MMYHGNCKCPHHLVAKVMMLLVWVAGVVFFWAGLKGVAVWGYEPLFYAWAVVVLSLMAFGMKYCECCGIPARVGFASSGGEKMCSHEEGCKCGDCDRCH